MSEARFNWGPWLVVQKTFVYCLNSRGCNRIWFNVSAGHDDDGNRVSDEELARAAAMARAAPELYEALEELLAAHEAVFPPGSEGQDAQTAWAERKAKANAAARAALSALGDSK